MGQESLAGPLRPSADAAVRRTVVAVHAHPDDEAILTGGTLAGLARAGHRVVLVTATDGGAGAAARRYAQAPGGLAARRREELAVSARALGVTRTVRLGHADSGLGGPDGQERPRDGAGRTVAAVPAFAALDPAEVAAEVAEVVAREPTDLLLGYDAAGGYGHPDHLQVHRVARLVARATGVRLLEATAPREPLALLARVVGGLRRRQDLTGWREGFTPREAIGYRVDVGPDLAAKRAALLAHASQATSGESGALPRTLALVRAVPTPVLRAVLGTEYFVDPAASGRAYPGSRVPATALLAGVAR